MRRAIRACGTQPRDPWKGRAEMPRVRPLLTCDTSGIWRRTSNRACNHGRRTAGERRRSSRPALRGPGRQTSDRAMQEAGIDRAGVYVTNAVKHFKFEERGKRRIHKKPSTSQVRACRPWLDAEIESVGAKVIVCLGATAAQALLGNGSPTCARSGAAP